MELLILEAQPAAVRAGYACPCGCTPSVAYARDTAVAEEGCCCGNAFAVGPNAAAALTPRVGFEAQRQVFQAPWGEPLEAAWLIGPSVHGPDDAGHDHGEDDRAGTHSHDGTPPDKRTLDPVCGMTVEPESARAKGLHSTFSGTDYFFCGKGCKLEFDDDPDRYLDPSFIPSM